MATPDERLARLETICDSLHSDIRGLRKRVSSGRHRAFTESRTDLEAARAKAERAEREARLQRLGWVKSIGMVLITAVITAIATWMTSR